MALHSWVAGNPITSDNFVDVVWPLDKREAEEDSALLPSCPNQIFASPFHLPILHVVFICCFQIPVGDAGEKSEEGKGREGGANICNQLRDPNQRIADERRPGRGHVGRSQSWSKNRRGLKIGDRSRGPRRGRCCSTSQHSESLLHQKSVFTGTTAYSKHLSRRMMGALEEMVFVEMW
ncbi:unnamed protein product [Linum trigynum]|uniref:Uncharacterized protein n=1 Tax=Linum trigynum TaxID=586398 RepID=A0AAV2GFI6_9ROSI